MATRLYLPSSGSPPVLPAPGANWERSIASFFRAPTSTVKSNTTLTDFSSLHGSTAADDTRYAQFISDTLDVDQTISGTFSVIVRCKAGSASEFASLGFVARVIKPDLSDRGVLYDSLISDVGTQWDDVTASTKRWNALTVATVAALAGDRIVIELGDHANGTQANATANIMRYGDPSAVADFVNTNGLTTDLCPWAELSQNITFGVAGPSVALTGTVLT